MSVDIIEKVCAECGEKSEKKYCSKKCADRAWYKSDGYLKNKCIECGERCHNLYCSRKCSAKKKITLYTDNCERCGKEFTYHRIGDKLRGGMKYCSYKCSATIYSIKETFFTENGNIPLIYSSLGVLFSYGKIQSYDTHDIDLYATKAELGRFNKVLGSNYPIRSAKGNRENKHKDKYRLTIRSKVMMDYLFDIGFSHIPTKHTFPLILDEYKKFFIFGYINTSNATVHEKKDHNLIIVKAKSFDLIKGIADVTNGEIVTKHLEFCCVIKDYDRFYRKLA